MSFTGNENHGILVAEAASMTKSFRDNNPGEPLGGFFGKDALMAILSQEGCVGIRYYNAETAEGKHTVVLAGVDSNEDDLVNGVLAEFAKPTPPHSGSLNSLNS